MRGSGFWILFLSITILVMFFYYVTIIYSYLCSRTSRNYFYREFYECGFKMIPDMRVELDLQFSIIGFIFLIYDIEIIILVPLIMNIFSLPYISYLLLWSVLIILTFSYYYEWDKYVLQWGFN